MAQFVHIVNQIKSIFFPKNKNKKKHAITWQFDSNYYYRY